MLYISNSVINRINQECKNMHVEQGWLIGCKMDFEYLDSCYSLVASYADANCYIVDSKITTEAIRRWAENGVCNIGFIHSHLVDKEDFSLADRESANSLLKSLNMPFLYFGIVVITPDVKTETENSLFMYLAKDAGERGCIIEQIPYVVID